ncbi:initiator tRNA phosphoribosyl transferase [Chiua virens]|nr:initiator tRNA phosphoribosyl transferase [Chiua virens]
MDTAKALGELRRESQSIFNRIHSIAEDAAFVKQVYDHYPDLPLLPNMRCGAWYTDPKIASTERAYFKSTDGHTNNWSFNLRRPNLHILPLIIEHAGLVLVDSTRAGKRIPDALSKTVPMWCAVVNTAILKRATGYLPEIWDTTLYTPPGSVSLQEHSQITLRLDRWASELAASSYRLPELDRPLRPIWITPATTVFPTFPNPPDHEFYPIICVSASKQVANGTERRASGFAYIQGSGDDHELWGMGLTPNLYWKHHHKILTTGSSELPDLVRSLLSNASQNHSIDIDHNGVDLSEPDSESLRAHPNAAFLCLTPDSPDDPNGSVASTGDEPPRMLRIQTPDGKKGQHHFLIAVLPRSMPFIAHHLQRHRTICIACSTGTDMSVGVAVAALAVYFRADGSCFPQGNARSEISKDVVKTRLQWIISSYPQANPSRTTLKRVNDFLLSPLVQSSEPSKTFTSGMDE